MATVTQMAWRKVYHVYEPETCRELYSSTMPPCRICGKSTNVQEFEYHIPIGELPPLHEFINEPGRISCGACGLNKDFDTVHSQSSQSVASYRKPIAYRFDLIPPIALRQLAAIYEEGAKVYGESKYINSPMAHSNVVNHLQNHFNLAVSGDKTESHWAKVAWAAFTMIVYEELGIGKADLTNYGVLPDQKKLDSNM